MQDRYHLDETRGPKPLPMHLAIAALFAADYDEREKGERCYVSMLAGMRRYYEHDAQRNTQHLKTVTSLSSSTIYAHKDLTPSHTKTQRPFLLIPSLINSPAILDILPDCSLLAYLNRCGIPAFLLDWGDILCDPGLRDYTVIAKRLNGLVAQLKDKYNCNKVHGLGYCMGGHFLVAANALAPANYASLTFLGTPWDFAASDYKLAQIVELFSSALCLQLSVSDYLSPYWLHSIFALLEPDQVLHKFARFASMADNSHETALFVAVQDWLNTTTALPHDLAWAFVTQIVQQNALAKGEMLCDGVPIDPRPMHQPAHIIAPRHDRLASPLSTEALYRQMPRARLYTPDCGHIAPMCNKAVQDMLWPVIVDRIRKIDNTRVEC